MSATVIPFQFARPEQESPLAVRYEAHKPSPFSLGLGRVPVVQQTLLEASAEVVTQVVLLEIGQGDLTFSCQLVAIVAYDDGQCTAIGTFV